MPLLLLTETLYPIPGYLQSAKWVKRLLVFVFILFSFASNAQESNSWLASGFEEGNALIATGDYSAAVTYFDGLIKKADSLSIQSTETLAHILHKKGVALYILDKNTSAIDAYQQSLQIRLALLGDDHLDVARSYHNIGTCYEYLGKHDKAIEFIKAGLEIRKKHDIKKDLAYSYLRVGKNYFEKGDYDRALEYYSPALSTYIEFYDEVHPRVAEVYNHTGIAYYRKLNFDDAAENFTKALSILSDPAINDLEGQTYSLNNLGAVYYEAKAFDEALRYYQKSIAITQKLNVQDEVFALNHMNIGLAFKGLGNYPEADVYLRKAHEIAKTLLGEQDPRLAIYLDNLADLSAEQKDYTQTLNYYQEALKLLVPGFVSESSFTNPDLKNDDVTGSKSLLLTILSNKAKTIKTWWRDTPGDDKLLRYALETYEATDKLIDRMRREHTAKGSKLFWTGRTLPIYENAIETSLEMFTMDQGDQHLEQAFYFAEKSKSILLLESIKESDARHFTGLPDTLLANEVLLKAQLTNAEQALFNEQQKIAQDSALLKTLRQDVFELKEKNNNLIALFEKEHPDYFRMKYDMSVVRISDIKSLLKEGQAMINYFVGDSSVFIFKIEPNAVTHYQMLHASFLENDVKQFRDHLLNYFFVANSDDALFKKSARDYAVIAFQLYNRLIGPLKKDGLPETLIIIPDGVLGYLPFDALISEVPDHPDRFKSHAYLLNDFQISYSYSATLWREMLRKSNKKASKGLLAFAPSFDDQPSEDSRGMRNEIKLGRLSHNVGEVENIHQLLGGKALYGDKATEQAFRKWGPSYQVIHFATHGKANDENSDYSYLAFTEVPDSVENEFLYVHDLYNMKLNADLVVLSACETGIGKLYRGEGITSLARGFSYAGAPALVTTLWSVNDAQTSVIISDFYRNIKAGMSKDGALRNAKLDYIRSNDNYLAHPFFWAAAIPIGNMEAVSLSGSFPYLWTIIGLFALSGLFLLFKKIRS